MGEKKNIKKLIFESGYFKKKYSLIAISVVLFFVVVGLGVVAATKYKNHKGETFAKIDSADVIQEKIDRGDMLRRKIDGIYVDKDKADLPVTAVMINNHVDARPTTGLAQANIVYEAEVEGGITRFMALYSSDTEVLEIGSVRSARPYFVDWVNEYDALYSHCGGSPEALVRIVQDDIIDLNEFNKGYYYWRDNSRNAPHNIYTSTKKLNSYLEKNDIAQGDYFSWNFKEDENIDSRPASSSVEINYRLKSFVVRWEYDRDANGYNRYVANKLHKEKSGEYIFAKNIVIQTADAEVLDEKLRLRMDVLGEGMATVCMDGVCNEGKWKKKSKTSRTRYYNEEDIEFDFNAGSTWIQVIRPEIEVNIE